ncbi:MAG: RnfABCDGE type electron transport complex subunit B [Candidatus Margulisiibacteriota bacterium]
MIIFASIIALSILGLVSGLMLGFAYQKLSVKEDPRVAKVLSVLPGANCGACGYAGCKGFAEALVAGKVDASGCLFGGDKITKILTSSLGLEESKEKEKKVAYLLCGGGKAETEDRFKYQGAPNCRSANATGGGFKACTYGCLGFGDCVTVCPVDAISMSDDKLPVVDVGKCIACGKCIKICPRDLFILLPKRTRFHVKCNSKDKGAFVRKVCKVGCIACNLCQKACPHGAITIENNLAVIDQNKCKNAGECIKVCPMRTIVEFKS